MTSHLAKKARNYPVPLISPKLRLAMKKYRSPDRNEHKLNMKKGHPAGGPSCNSIYR